MRILFLTPQLPYPPRQGTALRNWGLISGLASRHEIWLLSFDPRLATGSASLSESGWPPELQAACARVAAFPPPRRGPARRLAGLFTSSLPDMAWRLWSPAFAAQIRDWAAANRFDIIQAEGIELARYALESTVDSRQSTPVVFDDHNCEYLLQKRSYDADVRRPARWHAAAYSAVQWRRLRSFERRVLAAAQATLCVSEQDADALRRIGGARELAVIPNGIDLASYSAAPEPPADPARPLLVFTGKMDFRPNIDAALWFGGRVWPRITAEFPGARLRIVGRDPSPRLDGLRAAPGVEITGEVDDTRPHIAAASVYVAPLRVGGGTRFKLLEAMAMRRALVTTSLGCEGFALRDGREALIADAPEAFAGAVARLLRDDRLRADLGSRARSFVAARYDWSAIIPRLEQVYARLGRAPARIAKESQP